MRDEAAAAKATTIAADLSDEHGHSLAKPARAGQARQRSCTVQHATAVAALLVRRGAQPERLASAEATLRRHSLRGAARNSRSGAPRCATPSVGRRRRLRWCSWRGAARAALSARRGPGWLHDRRRQRLRLRSLRGVARGAALSARGSERLGSAEAAASAAPSERRRRSSARLVARLGLGRRRPRRQRSSRGAAATALWARRCALLHAARWSCGGALGAAQREAVWLCSTAWRCGAICGTARRSLFPRGTARREATSARREARGAGREAGG